MRSVFGRMGEEMLLGGRPVVAEELRRAGFAFRHETLDEALEAALTA